jgi:hypothetical protein
VLFSTSLDSWGLELRVTKIGRIATRGRSRDSN